MSHWKDVDGFPGYRVSDSGQVVGPGRHGREVELKPNIRNAPYQSVRLYREGKKYWKLIHRLVLESFVLPAPENMQADHIDGDPTNNSLSNLEWVTPSINSARRSARLGGNPNGRRQACLRGHLNDRDKYGRCRQCRRKPSVLD